VDVGVPVASIANAASAARLIDGLLSGMEIADARFLIRVGATIWLINVIVFALWYWELDGQGPARRAHDRNVSVDLLFPQRADRAVAPPDWSPHFVDYLYVSFTNAITLSPGETAPLARWVKLTMMLQAGVSLATLALVVARAVECSEGGPRRPLARRLRSGPFSRRDQRSNCRLSARRPAVAGG
jgi:hypothetical protein